MNPTDPNQSDPNAVPAADPNAGQTVQEAPVTPEFPATPEAPVTPEAPTEDPGMGGGDQNPAGGAPVV
ncbi:hypothetical protein A3J19_04270 [Candidatus Daviesbacteria bacterium RIFCSPLOWO2_02_FULL_41_8]|uniref:Uncharacterized protein n=3 Tax=Candidatus Daviesiibacteriota TaxID=1752718 RepID=A0A1F5NLK3_9BACT|nr:MAG: hypothetical protein A2871_00680 [Candidatus Daviesbacteria bacterium RIFCSPHIGHO2_01_FULL_41_23]OGE33420.1 MAG: hypothetical protein A3D83_00290 [Candidatus Daviesbacteria bacterium RIFCSPHIGHO2_02_FULL_41_10]OGE62410.1 MAG: hypothetical protein A2967_01170 [Candidatus Daviesbacteria bacterium RIFCSPLOWO2_01_FULL_41_32]OGE78561.1 MAG: hypothetical protein A3J19_04270 [Candidatus Daviesbacteria bacterium RIFCSPLOWO2_02_FULL_41_8]